MLSSKFLRQIAHLLSTIFLVYLSNLGCYNICHRSYLSHANPDLTNLTSDDDLVSSLKNLTLNGHFIFDNTSIVAFDFGNKYHFKPLSILLPKTVSDISTTIKYVYNTSNDNNSKLTITPRGHGHSFQGQSQNEGGIVISMESLEEPKIQVVQIGELPYVDVSGGELWINVLHETLKQGLAPKSWTDYLNMSIGGTLSNGGIGGETFRHGPQINNIYQLEVVTGKGDILNCSEDENADLFYSVLGGLGQFGIITKARISLEKAPKLVKWIRVMYSNFSLFTNDQEQLISASVTFDFIEGFVISGLGGTTLYGLEVAKFFNPEDASRINQEIENSFSTLNYIPHTTLQSEIPYVDFLDRIHLTDLKLQGKDLRNVINPWFTLFIPKSKIHVFAVEVFENILSNTTYGPILIYPFNQTSWKDKTSLVTPTEDVIYAAAFLTSVTPSSDGSSSEELESILTLNRRILDFCNTTDLGAKEYAPRYETQDGWRAHFGPRWDVFAQRKSTYDPNSILTPEQSIFPRG